jgi:hypothetical protein
MQKGEKKKQLGKRICLRALLRMQNPSDRTDEEFDDAAQAVGQGREQGEAETITRGTAKAIGR